MTWSGCRWGKRAVRRRKPLKKEEPAPERRLPREWEPFETLRRQVDRMFEDFGRGFGLWRPFGRSILDVKPSWPFEEGWGKAPAVDVCEREKEYEITAELPGMDTSNIDVKLANGVLTIKGEKKEEKEENVHVMEACTTHLMGKLL